MPVDHHVTRDDAQGEDWPDKTVAVIERRNSARECTETYERIMGLLAVGERLTGRAPGPKKHPQRRAMTDNPAVGDDKWRDQWPK
jgi:hypothetical protein